LGFHPWLPRTPGTVLRFHAEDVWLEDDRHLPIGRKAVVDVPEWDFSELRPLPADWINNAFGGWKGFAELHWPERCLSVGIEASEELSVCILYSPGEAASFLCFEPVSHPVNAHNLPAEDNLLRRLVPGATMHASCRFAPRRILDGDRQ
jgi:aldose 1-epimerase